MSIIKMMKDRLQSLLLVGAGILAVSVSTAFPQTFSNAGENVDLWRVRGDTMKLLPPGLSIASRPKVQRKVFRHGVVRLTEDPGTRIPYGSERHFKETYPRVLKSGLLLILLPVEHIEGLCTLWFLVPACPIQRFFFFTIGAMEQPL